MAFEPDQINEFMQRAVSGVSKTSLCREWQEMYGWSEEDVRRATALCSFKAKPKKIDYYSFYDLKLDKKAVAFPYKNTQFYVKEHFLLDSECDALIEMIEQNLVPSTVSDAKDIGQISGARTSSSADLNRLSNETCKAIDDLICEFMGLETFLGEAIQGQKYTKGQFFKEHWDSFDRWSEHYKCYCEWMGQRTWTTMVYLNDVKEGGETYFKFLNAKIKPRKGTLVTWNNLYKNGKVNRKTMHEALPPTSGEKYIITKWWRSWPLI